MTAKRLYLHIGTHKTGTTSFQASLGANLSRLKRRGYHAFSLPGRKVKWYQAKRRRYNVGKVAHTFMRPGMASIARLEARNLNPNPENQAKLRAKFLADLKAITAQNLIVSAEGFTFLRTAEEKALVRDFLEGLGREVTIILVARGEEGWRASWENQLRKKPKVWKRTQKLPDEQRADGEWYYDWQSILDFWSDLGDLRIVSYDEAMASEGNAIPAVYRAMDLEPKGLKLGFESNRRVALEEEDEDDAG